MSRWVKEDYGINKSDYFYDASLNNWSYQTKLIQNAKFSNIMWTSVKKLLSIDESDNFLQFFLLSQRFNMETSDTFITFRLQIHTNKTPLTVTEFWNFMTL